MYCISIISFTLFFPQKYSTLSKSNPKVHFHSQAFLKRVHITSFLAIFPWYHSSNTGAVGPSVEAPGFSRKSISPAAAAPFSVSPVPPSATSAQACKSVSVSVLRTESFFPSVRLLLSDSAHPMVDGVLLVLVGETWQPLACNSSLWSLATTVIYF